MFAKLLKYEWRGTSRLLGIFSLAALGAGILGIFALRFLVKYIENGSVGSSETEEMLMALWVGGMGVFLVFLLLALAAYVLGTQIVLLHRFYKNKFTDEGYLTFTLPVTARQITLSSWMNMVIWTVISMLVVLVLAWVAESVLFTIPPEDFVRAIMSALKGGYAALSVVSSLVEILVFPLITMACITIGAVGAKKHKILLSIAVYYGYGIIWNLVNSVISTVLVVSTYTTGMADSLYLSVVFTIICQLAVGVICWFVINRLMTKKLNLP